MGKKRKKRAKQGKEQNTVGITNKTIEKQKKKGPVIPAVNGAEVVTQEKETPAGYIFMCNGRTKPECYKYHVFGLPSGNMDVVERIKEGTNLFLYDFDLKLLYGVYKAISNGGRSLESAAFGGRFPAQVRFGICTDGLPLPESDFKHAILENYNGRRKFRPELSNEQVGKLISMFRPLTLPPSGQVAHLLATSSSTVPTHSHIAVAPPPSPAIHPHIVAPPPLATHLRVAVAPPPPDPYHPLYVTTKNQSSHVQDPYAGYRVGPPPPPPPRNYCHHSVACEREPVRDGYYTQSPAQPAPPVAAYLPAPAPAPAYVSAPAGSRLQVGEYHRGE